VKAVYGRICHIKGRHWCEWQGRESLSGDFIHGNNALKHALPPALAGSREPWAGKAGIPVLNRPPVQGCNSVVAVYNWRASDQGDTGPMGSVES